MQLILSNSPHLHASIKPVIWIILYHPYTYSYLFTNVHMWQDLWKGSYSLSKYIYLTIHNLICEYGTTIKFGHYISLT